MEHKTFSTMEYKILDEDQGIVEHFVAVTGNRDLGNDRIIKGAFRKTLNERGLQIKVLDQHRTDSIQAVIGKPVKMQEVGREKLPPHIIEKYPDATGGLLVTTQYLMDTPEGKGAFLRIKSGAVSEYSIGYDSIGGATEYIKSADGISERHLKEIKLYEYGPVIFAMNPAAATLSAKDADLQPSEGKPYRNVPDNLTDKMDSCVEKVQAQGQDKETAIAICYASVVEGKSLVEAYHLQGIEYIEPKGGDPISQRKAGRVLSAANVTRIKNAMSALHEALSMAGALEMEEDEPEEKTEAAPTETKGLDINGNPSIINSDEKQNSDAAGPSTSPTDSLLKLIELELSDLHYRR